MHHGVVFGGNRSVTCGAFGNYGNVDGNLFAGLHGDVLYFAVLRDNFAAFVDGITGGEFVPVPGDEGFDAGFFASSSKKNNIAIEASVRTLQCDEGGQVGCQHGLVVQSATAVNVAVFHDRAERVNGPAGTFGADHIHMSDQEQGTRRIGNGGAAQAGDQGAAPGRDFEKFGRDSLFFQNAGDIFCGSLFVTGRVGGVDLNELRQPNESFPRERDGVSRASRCRLRRRIWRNSLRGKGQDCRQKNKPVQQHARFAIRNRQSRPPRSTWSLIDLWASNPPTTL